MNAAGFAAAFALGLTAAALSAILIKYVLRLKNDSGGGALFVRLVFEAGLMLLLYFAAPYTPFNRTALLIGGVAGITAGIIIKTAFALKAAKAQNSRDSEGDKK